MGSKAPVNCFSEGKTKVLLVLFVGGIANRFRAIEFPIFCVGRALRRELDEGCRCYSMNSYVRRQVWLWIRGDPSCNVFFIELEALLERLLPVLVTQNLCSLRTLLSDLQSAVESALDLNPECAEI